MGVMLQAFYWDCPKLENKEYDWWNFINEKIPALAGVGFTALWLPPVSKAANIGGPSMGYDPYDYYDLGDIDQKGSVKTWFGGKTDLKALIDNAHTLKMQVYADLVLNHTNGADEQEINPIDGVKRWTKYEPASGKFRRDWSCYHPSIFERYDNKVFEGMPDLCHRNPGVYTELMEYGRWLIEDIGFDGFRYDFVKGYGVWLINALLERLYIKDGKYFSPFGVGEYWDNTLNISKWIDKINTENDNPVSAFDFGLRARLKELCDNYEFDLSILAQPGTLITDGKARRSVTFVENHDIIRHDSIVNDKMLAYAYILTHEGYPCVFCQDYYNYQLAEDGWSSGIAALVGIHEKYAAGETQVLYCDNDLYIMQRAGSGNQPGLVFVLNNSGTWNGKLVNCRWPNQQMKPVAWRGKNNSDTPFTAWTNGNGAGDFWAPPRGYAVYVPA